MAIAMAFVLLAGAGLLLILGLCTPIAGTLVALVEVCRVVRVPTEKLACLLLATLAASLAMLGPGQWSVDARLFGWKRIEPSPRKRQPSDPQSPAVPYKNTGGICQLRLSWVAHSGEDRVSTSEGAEGRDRTADAGLFRPPPPY